MRLEGCGILGFYQCSALCIRLLEECKWWDTQKLAVRGCCKTTATETEGMHQGLLWSCPLERDKGLHWTLDWPWWAELILPWRGEQKQQAESTGNKLSKSRKVCFKESLKHWEIWGLGWVGPGIGVLWGVSCSDGLMHLVPFWYFLCWQQPSILGLSTWSCFKFLPDLTWVGNTLLLFHREVSWTVLIWTYHTMLI